MSKLFSVIVTLKSYRKKPGALFNLCKSSPGSFIKRKRGRNAARISGAATVGYALTVYGADYLRQRKKFITSNRSRRITLTIRT